MPDPYAPLKMMAEQNLTGRATSGFDETFESGLQFGWQQMTAAGLQRERQELLSDWVDRFKNETGVDVWQQTQKRLMAATGKTAEQTGVTDQDVARTLFELMNERAEKADQTISDSAALFEAELGERYKTTAKDFAETMALAPWGAKYLGGYVGAMAGGIASDPAALALMAFGGPEIVGARTLGAATRVGAMLRGFAVGGAIDAATNAAYSYFDQLRMNEEYARVGARELIQSPGEAAAYGAIGGYALGGLASAYAARQMWRHATVDEPAQKLMRTIDERASFRETRPGTAEERLQTELVAAGRAPEEAFYASRIAGAMFDGLGRYIGKTGADVLDEFGVSVQRGAPPVNVVGVRYDQSAYHGSPYEFESFDLQYLGTGEGAQVYGWGLYFAEQVKTTPRYAELPPRVDPDAFLPEGFDVGYGGKSLGADLPKTRSIDDFIDSAVYEVARAVERQLGIGQVSAFHHTIYEIVADVVETTAASGKKPRLLKRADLVNDPGFKEAISDPDARQAIADALTGLTITPGEQRLTGPKLQPTIYKVDVPDKSELLDYDKPLNEQPQKIQDAAVKIAVANKEKLNEILGTSDRTLLGYRVTYGDLALSDVDINNALDDWARWRPDFYDKVNRDIEAAGGTAKLSDQVDVRPDPDGFEPASVDTIGSILVGALDQAGYFGKQDGLYKKTSFEQIVSENRLDELLSPVDLKALEVVYEKFKLGPPDLVEPDPSEVLKLTGERFYKGLADALYSEREASAALHAQGIDGLMFYDGWVRNKVQAGKLGVDQATHNFVIWNEQAVKIIDRKPYVKSEKILFQTDARGSVTITDAMRRISLSAKADASTFIHETGHVFLDLLQHLAARNADAKADFATVTKWLGATEGKLTREHHEQFARAFERYVAEGQAPTEKLRSAFEAFKDFMRQIYRALTELGSELSPEIRDLFDRTLGGGRPHPSREALNEAALARRPVDPAAPKPDAEAPESGPDAPPRTTPEPSPDAVLDQFVEWRQSLDRALGPEAGAAAAELLAREAAQIAATGTETPAEVLARVLGLDTGSMHGSRSIPAILDELDAMPAPERLEALSAELRLSGEPGHVALANQIDAVEELQLIIRTCLSKGAA